jgi:hypothetical protein
MANRISGPGLGLPLPQFLYPSQLYNVPPDVGSNKVVLSPGAALPLPPGDLLLTSGAYSFLQMADPITVGRCLKLLAVSLFGSIPRAIARCAWQTC